MLEGERRRTGQLPPQEIRLRHRAFDLDRPETHALNTPLTSLRHDLTAIVHAGIARVNARALVAHALKDVEWHRPLWILATGKAAADMARAGRDAAGSHLAGGLVIAPSLTDDVAPLTSVIGNHPVPGNESVSAGEQALALARRVAPDEELLVLISGGASAMMAAPADGIALEEKQATTGQLLKRGADIHALNTVRKHLSRIKGGHLAAAVRGCCRSLVISDVVGDDLSVIASGPTVADRSTFANALDVLTRHGGVDAYPPAVVARLRAGTRGALADTPKPGNPAFDRGTARVIGGRRDAMRGAANEAKRRGYHVIVLDAPVVGEARVVGRALIGEWLEQRESWPRPCCLIASGETTVTVGGKGRGGRNQELALAAVEILAESGLDVAAASVGTDGVDGPTDAAGAIVDSTTAERARRAGVGNPEEFLAANDAYHYFDRLGDLIRTGPTGTNVGDLQVVLIT